MDDLGSTLLELVRGDPDAVAEVGGVAIHDPLDRPVLPVGALVLGVGLSGVEDITDLLGELGRSRAAALVLRSPVTLNPRVSEAADDAGVVLLGLTRGATWVQLDAMLRSLLADGDVGAGPGGPESLGGLPSGDLFAVANAIAALLDAPVTIEDRSNRVLAFSGRQDETDQGRIETVLGLQVPDRYARVLTERGVFGELFRSSEPIAVDPVPDRLGDPGASLPRAAIAVRAGDELLGSIWAVLDQPLDDARAATLKEAAKLVALHLLRVRAGADVGRRLRAELVGTALEGGAGAREAVDRLGLKGRPTVVLALCEMRTPADTRTAAAVQVADHANDRQRLTDAFAMHLSAVQPASATALIGTTVYGLLPVSGADQEPWAVRVATDFIDRIGDRLPSIVGVGPTALDAEGLAHARQYADRTVRVLRELGGAPRVAQMSDVYISSLLSELRDQVTVRGDRVTGPLARLVSYDAVHGTDLVQTLRAWLDAFGDVNAAAAVLFVHPNTFRYRLRRLAEVGELDLADPDARFAALLQLRIFPIP
ncbi:PucR family transcriptional regulator [Allobranchiibius huperziae]|nr:helix-turn-helix domain-containing protein [Allobranchiibius huperziae]